METETGAETSATACPAARPGSSGSCRPPRASSWDDDDDAEVVIAHPPGAAVEAEEGEGFSFISGGDAGEDAREDARALESSVVNDARSDYYAKTRRDTNSCHASTRSSSTANREKGFFAAFVV